MNPTTRLTMLAAALLSINAQAEDRLAIETVIVTARAMSDPYHLEDDPRRPQLGLPAQDGGAWLKSTPGFSVSRKGGTSGDPALRGMGGSRLGISANDTLILGGCGGRMDPPTAYIHPEAYDRVEITKGPQSVRYGPTGSGTVRFKREAPRFDEPTVIGYASSTTGNFDRQDFSGELTGGSTQGYIRLLGSTSTQGDYRTGGDVRIHSAYQRWNNSALLGWTPDHRTRVEAAIERGDGWAAYEDRGMDGTRFDRRGYSLRASREELTPWLASVEAQVFHNAVDHVMDNYRLRQPPNMPMVSFPERVTQGARLEAELTPNARWLIYTGIEQRNDQHRGNRLMGEQAFNVDALARLDTAEFDEQSLFVEAERNLNTQGRITLGARLDQTRAEVLTDNGFGGAGTGSTQRTEQHSGFVRYSHPLSQPLTAYIGLGHSERAPDYWERQHRFDLNEERLTQLDSGLRYRSERLAATASVFYGEFSNFILVAGQGGPSTRAVDATTTGGELDITYQWTQRWRLESTLTLLHNRNTTDDQPLAQSSPHELTLGVNYSWASHSIGLHSRLVARQDRIHRGYGSIFGQDTQETPGFGTLAFYWEQALTESLQITAGIDNLLDRAYAEHLQRGEAELGASTRVIDEPGRSAWLRVAMKF